MQMVMSQPTIIDTPNADGLYVCDFYVHRLHWEPEEFTAACPGCGLDITWVAWWFEGTPRDGGLLRHIVTSEPGPCTCDGVQVVRKEVATT